MYENADPGKEEPLFRIRPPTDNGQWEGARAEMKHFCMDRHNKAVNAVFFDMSVEKIDLKRLWKLKWHKEFDSSGYPRNGGVWPAWMQSMKE